MIIMILTLEDKHYVVKGIVKQGYGQRKRHNSFLRLVICSFLVSFLHALKRVLSSHRLNL